jgi:hypothetical protein
MKLSEFKSTLSQMDGVNFLLPNGTQVPSHFHVTELGSSTKHFIDCGGTERLERKATFQLWTSIDLHHRLKAEKLIRIIDIAAPLFAGEDPEVELEYQQETIGRFGLEVEDDSLQMTALQTDCLAKENCGIPVEKVKKVMASLTESACTPGGGCC